MKIGCCEFPHGLSLAPLAGFTDHAMRTSCHGFGAEYTVSEMISAKAVCYGDKKTPALAKIYASDGPTAIQLFGSEAHFMAEAAKRLFAMAEESGTLPFAFDINMGCPVPKVAGNGEGSALMKTPALAAEIVAAMVKATPLPVTVKIRAGWDGEHKNAPELAKMLEEAGAAAICVHGRTRAEMYSGKADLSVIAAVKAAVSIPVIGNGDVTDAESALRMKRETGCDGIAVGRGAVGNPFVFREIIAAMEGHAYEPPTGEERYAAAITQLRLRAEEKGERMAVLESRKQMAAFLHDFKNAPAARARIHEAESIADMERELQILCAL
jgi:nifR3 family TIM-barrel protein